MKQIFFFLLFVTLFPAFGQDGEDIPGEPQAPAESLEQPLPYILRSAQVNIEGWTQKNLLLYNLKIAPGQAFPSKEDFTLWLEDTREVLGNFRMLVETRIEYTQEEGEEEVWVDLVISAQDSWAIIVLPRPRYDSNVGLRVSLSGRDYNFLGTMEPLRVNLDYDVNSAFESTWGLELDGTYPLLFGQEYFLLGLNNYYTLHPGLESENRLNGYLEYQRALFDLDFAFRVSQDYYFAPRDSAGDVWADHFLRNEFSLKTAYSFPFFLPGLGNPSYSPRIYVRRGYVLGEDYRTDPEGVQTGFDHSLSFGRINWRGNHREGLKAKLSNLLQFDYNYQDWDRRLEFEVQGMAQWEWISLVGRGGSLLRFDSENTSLGGYLRGILDNRVSGDLAYYLNTQLHLSVLDFRPSVWFSQDWMRIFDMEIQMAPFADFMLSRDQEQWSHWMGAGLEMFAFSHFAKSLFLRGSLGIDYSAFMETGSITAETPLDGSKIYEVFIGLGFMF